VESIQKNLIPDCLDLAICFQKVNFSSSTQYKTILKSSEIVSPNLQPVWGNFSNPKSAALEALPLQIGTLSMSLAIFDVT